MTQKKTYQAPAATIYSICIEQPLLNNSTNLMISDDETTTVLTNKKGFADDLWSNMNGNDEPTATGIWK